VTIYERDGGVLWRHAGVSRRARQLVISGHATIDNYDFIFNWIFGEDGAIEVEVQLTGLMLLYRAPAEPAPSSPHASAHRVGEGWLAPVHQHFFSYRLDFDLDGTTSQRLLEVDTRALRRSRRTNPGAMAFEMEERTLESERAAIRPADPAAARFWKVVRGSGPGGYALLPGAVAIPFAARKSPLGRQVGFAFAQLCATPWRRDEMYAAGEFQNFGAQEAGLPGWTRGDRRLTDQDLVLWHTVGVTHLPRAEEYPVMPAARAAFRLVPVGFFSGNPALAAERASPKN
jgi:primary-amine oxidase